jgi:hypothetical protein
MTSLGEISRYHIVFEVKPPDDALIDTFAAARYNRMFTSSNDLSGQIVTILELRLEMVGRPKRVVATSLSNEDFVARLMVDPAGRSCCGLDECVKTVKATLVSAITVRAVKAKHTILRFIIFTSSSETNPIFI